MEKEDILQGQQNSQSQDIAPDATEMTPDKAVEEPKGGKKDKPHPVRRAMGGYGALFTLLGWATMVLNPWLSGGCAALGLILSIIGTCIPRSARRNLAITSIVASSVLLLVLSIFIVGLHFI